MANLKIILFVSISLVCVNVFALQVQSTTPGELKFLKSLKTESLDGNSEKNINLTEPAIFTSQDHVPVLLVPICSPAANKIQISAELVDGTTAVKNATNKFSDGLAIFVDGYESFETAMGAKNINEAQAKLNQLTARFPNVPFLFLPQASLAYLRGQNAEAKRLIEKYLEFRPNDPHALRLLSSLKGGTK